MVIFGNVYRDSMCLFLKILIHFNLLLINLYDISIMICNFTTVKVLVCVLCGLCYVCLCACRHLRCWCRCAMMPRRTCGVSVPLSACVHVGTWGADVVALWCQGGPVECRYHCLPVSHRTCSVPGSDATTTEAVLWTQYSPSTNVSYVSARHTTHRRQCVADDWRNMHQTVFCFHLPLEPFHDAC